ncbi:putative Transcriptional regulator, LytTr family [Tenacibaculum sediminilitoris]|uniref:LytTR family transcriptional regulator DNA-binding domain-containing protein n=1 Tax=Tenacibaculum sediminilitoris TaxID=1820334 RepID=UPI003893C51E
MKKYIYSFLKEDIPRGHLSYNPTKTSLYIFTIVFYLLSFFQPFGLSTLESIPLIILTTGYSIISVLGYSLAITLFKPFYRPKWTRFHEFLTYNTAFIFIWAYINTYSYFCFNFLFTQQWLDLKNEIIISEDFYLKTLYYTLGTGYFIYIILRIYDISFSYLNKNKYDVSNNELKKISFLKKTAPTITLTGKNKNESITMDKASFVCIISKGHYVNIYYFCKNSFNLKQEIFRNSLKNIELQLLPFSFAYRCHNSFIININLLKSVYGNSYKSYARIEHFPKKIPISQNKISFMKNVIKEKNKS